ncbi:2-phosphosulfolactate phosphatase [Microbacterium sp. No. 7]|uniref:2-phosphosulfolactate phosphatase n=1 Tax=Microbacterium sp. No. 7 TaxID=1714373 RepID=UPI0006D2A028|nr:2-phosphosulfolactate phosphatase [Microbacterium sp. No. 7]ALJ18975.1 hypothetical protein AOA12_03255 [Microbacterium sp. No. 7]
MPSATAPHAFFDQASYQVRFEWGVAGLDRLAPADVVVVVDVLGLSTDAVGRVAAGDEVAPGALALADAAGDAVGAAGVAAAARIAARAAGTGATVLLGCLRNASATAAAVLAEQSRRGARTSVAVIAAGDPASADPASGDPGSAGLAVTGMAPSGSALAHAPLRFAVEDLLGAGAVIDGLTALGIDHTSPEAAAASEAFRGLRGAVRHLLTASGSGRERADGGFRAEVESAASLDATPVVPVLRGGVLRA